MITNKIFEGEKELNIFASSNGYKIISIETVKKEKYTGLMTMQGEFTYMADYLKLWYDDGGEKENF